MSIGVGMIPLVAPQAVTQQMPHAIHPLLDTGILLAAISAVLLNLFFNGLASSEQARQAARDNTHGAE